MSQPLPAFDPGRHHAGSVVNDPLGAGLHRRLVDADYDIQPAVWNRARAAGDIIGACRDRCPGLMVAEPTGDDRGSTVEWMEARCLKCGHAVAAPGGRTLAKSSRRHEMPSGFWSRRIEHLKQPRGARGKAAA